MTFRTAIDLWPNFQQPPLPSKIPGYAPYNANTKVLKWSKGISHLFSLLKYYYFLMLRINLYKWNAIKNLKLLWNHVSFNTVFMFLQIIIAARQRGFIVPYVWEILVKKVSQFSKAAIFVNFIYWFHTKNFNSDPCFFNLVKLGKISSTAHFPNCIHIKRKAAAS